MTASRPDPTDADREKAAELLGWSSADVVCARRSDTNDAAVLDGIAAALAAERETALAEAQSGLLAHRDPGVRRGDGDQFGKGWNAALNFAADWIGRQLRAAAAPSPATTTSEGNERV